jgi:hypothetical protein
MRRASGHEHRSGQRGQATVEWVALLLGVALALGALAGGVRAATNGGRDGQTALGKAVAQRITCAARDLCAAGARGPGGAGGTLGGTAREPRSSARRHPRTRTPAGALPAARGVGNVAKRAWIVCFGYRRWRSELAHPRTPRESMPLGETLDIVNDCINPWAFFFG